MKQRQIEEYEVNPYTMFIKPVVYGSKVYSQIYELEDEFLSPFKPLDIIKKSCEYFSSSFEGRKEGTKQLIGITHKVPIVIDPTNFIYFFPTTSPTRSECIWVSHEHIMNYRRTDPRQTLVTFQNKQSFILPISHSSFENQMLRTALLRTKLMQRIGQTERKSFYVMNRSKIIEASEASREYGLGNFFEHQS
ncbi:competence protein ComK [Bacillus sp. EB600]|uniref:competence protein ComK n=1 Tax=Bacillus sp. EB600 TaxID=2806345 RepID=UPI00210B42EB|nr:competence protein ComK [Bacillus sp. EB600]